MSNRLFYARGRLNWIIEHNRAGWPKPVDPPRKGYNIAFEKPCDDVVEKALKSLGRQMYAHIKIERSEMDDRVQWVCTAPRLMFGAQPFRFIIVRSFEKHTNNPKGLAVYQFFTNR